MANLLVYPRLSTHMYSRVCVRVCHRRCPSLVFALDAMCTAPSKAHTPCISAHWRAIHACMRRLMTHLRSIEVSVREFTRHAFVQRGFVENLWRAHFSPRDYKRTYMPVIVTLHAYTVGRIIDTEQYSASLKHILNNVSNISRGIMNRVWLSRTVVQNNVLWPKQTG